MSTVHITSDHLRTLLTTAAHQGAGAGSGAIMSKPGPARKVVMPSEEILAACEKIVDDLMFTMEAAASGAPV